MPIIFKLKTGVKTGAGEISQSEFTKIGGIQPEYPGGVMALYQEFANNFKIPEGLASGQESLLLIHLVIEKDGSMGNFEILKDNGLGADAVAALKKYKKWKPGMLNGKPARVSFNLPIRIKL